MSIPGATAFAAAALALSAPYEPTNARVPTWSSATSVDTNGMVPSRRPAEHTNDGQPFVGLPATTGTYLRITDVDLARRIEKLNALRASAAAGGRFNEPPTDVAFELASRVLLGLHRAGILPTHVIASAEGGVALCFDLGRRYADVEVFNTGEVLAVTSDRVSQPIVWSVTVSDDEALARSAMRIRGHLGL